MLQSSKVILSTEVLIALQIIYEILKNITRKLTDPMGLLVRASLDKVEQARTRLNDGVCIRLPTYKILRCS